MQRNAHFLVFLFHFSQIKLGWKRWDLTSQQQMQQTDSICIFKIFHSGCWPWSSYWRTDWISIDVWKWWPHKYEGALLEGLNQWPLDQYLLTKFDFLLESNGQHMSFLRWSVLSISRSPQSDRLVSSNQHHSQKESTLKMMVITWRDNACADMSMSSIPVAYPM